jgi:hypothetical protein
MTWLKHNILGKELAGILESVHMPWPLGGNIKLYTNAGIISA